MKILGIDPGSRATGYALLEIGRARVRFLEAGVLSIPRDEGLGARLAAVGEGLEMILDRCRPDESAVEDVFHALNAKSALKLAHARGVILCVLARRTIPTATYTPLQVKKAVSGYGFARKDALRALLERLLEIPGSALTDDASDAVAVALCHAQAIPLRDAVRAAEGRSSRERGDASGKRAAPGGPTARPSTRRARGAAGRQRIPEP